MHLTSTQWLESRPWLFRAWLFAPLCLAVRGRAGELLVPLQFDADALKGHAFGRHRDDLALARGRHPH